MSVWHPSHCVVSALTNFASHPPHSTNADRLLPFISLSLCICASHIHRTSTSPHPTPHLDFHPYLHRFAPQSLDSPGFQSIATLIIILLSKKNYTRNPYLIAKLVEVETQRIFLPFIPYVPFFHLASYLSRFTSPSLLFPTLHLTSPFTPPTIPNPSPHLTLHPAYYSQPFTSPHPPCTHPSPHLPSCTFQYSSLTHTSQPFSLSSCVIQYPPHSPHLSPPQVLFVMTPGIQRRTHSLFDQFQYHPLGENLSSVLMRIYIGEWHCYKHDAYILYVFCQHIT